MLDVLRSYSVVCKVRSDKGAGNMPGLPQGWFYPEDVIIATQVFFSRWPAGNLPIPCGQGYRFRDYTYKSINTFRPVDFWNIPPEQWTTLKKDLNCILKANENFGGALYNDINDISILAYAMTDIHLQPVNDTTYCFIPAAEEKLDFNFYYSNTLGLDSHSPVTFNVIDNQHHLVSVSPLVIPDVNPIPGDGWAIPGLPYMQGLPVSWDGRKNQAGHDPGRLADPNDDPYHCYVFVNEGRGMMSNVETFDVIPKIDSVLVTHHSWYPPTFYNDADTLFAVARGKWDDSGDRLHDYRYYIPEGENYPYQLGFWDNRAYVYWDAFPPPTNPTQYYEELGNYQLSNVGWWNSERWGSLAYRWFVEKDYAERNPSNGPQRLGYWEVDTTQWWGAIWNPEIHNDVDWWTAKATSFPYMRLLVASRITNNKNDYALQSVKSPDGFDGHKFILGSTAPYNNWDIVDWAVSHIGTPYAITDSYQYFPKIPYRHLDCSGLVVAARIQDIGSQWNTHYRLNSINVQSLVNGYYNYGGQQVPTETVPINLSLVSRGCAVALKSGATNWAHIGLVETYRYNGRDSTIANCMIIHARGGNPEPIYRRVRYDNLISTYRKPKYKYKFIEFENSK